MPAVFEYEVDLKLTNPNTGEKRAVTRIEHAYSPLDAYQQALLLSATDAGSAKIDLTYLGPPRRLIPLPDISADLARLLTPAT